MFVHAATRRSQQTGRVRLRKSLAHPILEFPFKSNGIRDRTQQVFKRMIGDGPAQIAIESLGSKFGKLAFHNPGISLESCCRGMF